MNSFYIYSFQYKEGTVIKDATVIYCATGYINESDLQAEIRTFYERNYQPDEIFAIGSSTISDQMKQAFIDNQLESFKGIPKKQETFLKDNLYLLTFDKDGILSCMNSKTIPQGFLDYFEGQGLQQIFIRRGGLIVSQSSHHFVFPSGKHCDKFLRTGNILLYSAEIGFIAFSLLKHYKEEQFNRIYCDTSSINSIAYSLLELKNRFRTQPLNISIESFSSYEGLYKKEESYTKDSLLLISASTSSNIIKYVLTKHQILIRDNIVLLYFLGKLDDYANVKDQVLCNLTRSEENENGVNFYNTYRESECEFCREGSYPVPVSGDVFLLETPKVNRIVLAGSDRERNLSSFVEQFLSTKRSNSILKSHFKERSDRKYEVYIDFSAILRSMNSNPRMARFRGKLFNFISQYVPFDTQYIIHLNDEGSKDLGGLIFDKIGGSYDKDFPKLIDQDKIPSIDEDKEGVAVVVGSCISNGKNLLYISRALRNYKKLRIIYFLGIVRTPDKQYYKRLSDNLKRGKYGGETNSIIAVETIYCSSKLRHTPWLSEIEFLKNMAGFIGSSSGFASLKPFFEDRRKALETGGGSVSKGISQKLFFPNVSVENFPELELRQNFAFFDFGNYDTDVAQSDIYFTISNIVNSLRHSPRIEKQLRQTVYVRSLLDPHNFSRFNDGIIQAAILRTANAEELSYNIDQEISQEMFDLLETTITYHKQPQGEALMEFLYAIAIKKMTLRETHINELLIKIRASCQEPILLCMAEYIEEKLIREPEKIRRISLDATKSSFP